MADFFSTIIKQLYRKEPSRYSRRREIKLALKEHELYGTDRGMRQRQRERLLAQNQRFVKDEWKRLGPDKYAAQFIFALGGSVRPTNRYRWFKDMDSINQSQTKSDEQFQVEGISASNTNLLYDGLDNLVDLEHLKHLDISHCPFIDDWCLNRLQRLKGTLESLDVSGCTEVSERGLFCLHHLGNLKSLKVENMEHIDHSEYVKLLLEDMKPGLEVIGLVTE